jgi:hypothetical protein
MIRTSRALFLAVIATTILLVLSPNRAEATAAQINADANNALHSFVSQIGGAKELANKAAGVLVFRRRSAANSACKSGLLSSCS